MRTQRRLGRLSLLAILTMLAGLILAGPAHATFPGPNGQIAFLEGTTGQLYTINPDGTGLRQLTHLSPPSFPTRPDWSPDGRRIAFADLGDARLYVIDRDGSHQHLVFADTSGYKDFFPNTPPTAAGWSSPAASQATTAAAPSFRYKPTAPTCTPSPRSPKAPNYGLTSGQPSPQTAAGSPSAGSPSAPTRHRFTSSGPTAAALMRSPRWPLGRSRPTGPPTAAVFW